SRGVWTPSLDLTKAILCSSRMISMQSSTHSSQMKTVGPAINLRTSCWLLPQKEQYRVFLESPPLALLFIVIHPNCRRSPRPQPFCHVSPGKFRNTTAFSESFGLDTRDPCRRP